MKKRIVREIELPAHMDTHMHRARHTEQCVNKTGYSSSFIGTMGEAGLQSHVFKSCVWEAEHVNLF